MKFTRHDLPYSSYSKWKETCQEGTWRKTHPSSLHGLIPEDLLNKTNSTLVMASASSQVSVFVANLNRVDIPDSAVDQQPYIIAFNHSGSTASGGFVHHGNWDGRTDKPDRDFFEAISASGIQAYFPLKEMPSTASGYLADLKVDSQKEAFWKALSLLEKSGS